MRRLGPLLLALLLGWPLTALAATPLAPELPPPDLVPFLPLTAPPLDKPPVALPEVALPAPPHRLPPLPVLRFTGEPSQKPVAPLPPPRLLPCNPLATVFGMASELYECGRARFQRQEWEEARATFEAVVRASADRSLVRRARYWLGETLLRLGRPEPAERNFLLVVQEGAGDEPGAYATYALGWIALTLNDPGRARDRFEELLRGPAVVPLAPHVSHGHALALYALGRFEEARREWERLLRLAVPPALGLEATLWLGDALGRVGEPGAAVERLRRFTAAGPHREIETAILRLGWWSLAAGDALEAVKAFRWLLSAYPETAERPWAYVGLARAFQALGDWAAAREEAGRLRSAAPGHPLVLPALFFLARRAVEAGAFEAAHAFHQDLLGLDLLPADRACTLLLDGEVYRREGRVAEARTQYELVRSAEPASPPGWIARLRLAQMDLEAREFARAAALASGLLGEPLPEDLLAPALLLHAEAAYWAGDADASAESYGRFLSRFPGHPQAGAATLALGWAELRRGQAQRARQRWSGFARYFPDDPRAPEALLLAAELAARAGEAGARDMLDELLSRYGAFEHADLARLNRAVLDLQGGRNRLAREELELLLARARASPFLGRMRLALGVALLAGEELEAAAREFRLALREGAGALARLGAGSAALGLKRWEDAARELTEARDTGTLPVAHAAEYALVALAFNRGDRRPLAKAGMGLLERPPSPVVVPPLLYALAAVAVEDRRWDEARGLTLRLVQEHPASEPADDALFRLGAGAAADRQWALAREAFQLLESRYPKSPLVGEIRLGLAEALLRGGALAEARSRLEAFVASGSGDPRLAGALRLLAEAREAAGDWRGALQAYSRFVDEFPKAEGAMAALLAQARLLLRAGRWGEARRSLERAVAGADEALAVEAAFRLGEGLRARGAHEEAVVAYMTAAYLGPASSWGQQALLGAGRSFTALKQVESAAIAYRKLLARPDADPALARLAREALSALGPSARARAK